MRTRLVRVRRRSGSLRWAAAAAALAAALYMHTALPAVREQRQAAEATVGHGERVTREIVMDALEVHLVSFGSFTSGSEARIEAARYVPRGAAGYVLDGDIKHVIGAGYAQNSEAARVCAQLEEAEGIACTVVSLKGPEVMLRVTAGSEQIGAFLLAEETVRETAGTLGNLAFSLDRGDASAMQARAVIQTQLGNTQQAAEELERQAGESPGGIFEEMGMLLRDMAARMEAMLDESGAMALSSALKHTHVEFRVREIGLLNGLSE